MSKAIRRAGILAGAIAAGLSLAFTATAAKADNIRIAYIEPLSGPFANVGDAGLRHFRFAAERINAEGGILGRQVEIVPMDNQQSAQESQALLQRAIDRGIPFVTQGNGSDVAGALVAGIDRHNRRNPNNRVLFLNYAAVDPALTNERCSFWHFRFDAQSDIKLEALTNYMQERDDIKKVFLINQDYSHGHAVAATAKRMLAEKRPDIEIVGETLHPIGQVRDFSPYINRIRRSGADSVITGNWGNDLALMVRAAEDAGLDVNFYTYYGGGLGVPAALGKAGAGRLLQITEWHSNVPFEEDLTENREWMKAFDERNPEINWYYQRIYNQMYMLKAAIEEAGTTEAKAVANALAGMSFESPTGTVYMRADDHQLIQPMYISVMDADVEYDVENSGVGFRTIAKIPAEETVVPTSCEMRRP
ncbi:branched-chain amino acid ABC transporter substrate-binding protein [Alkalilimnicola ehrlichii]|uniref:Branched-chain amino acid ABC transporter substrate-binding protein n=1 Tax=Alkalilimnicola ehrlichii TaxID=351052 RepID=A0A3E0WIR8_9GAMM|nr:branched-chain amino acid ABC transporter substrate-binding protein [Alkalilimnicola ehrlichii]RFA25751.1 branched-chain amino acid ABC transporter substrate-binding protein [Alkalilimnicola ehrlichii]RFA32834.1 branched-chain amino acid ABC transporter substrate-binding protein [Alkalilimnicola ehrlichii]